MAKGYWIAHNQISDAEAYEAYKIMRRQSRSGSCEERRYRL